MSYSRDNAGNIYDPDSDRDAQGNRNTSRLSGYLGMPHINLEDIDEARDNMPVGQFGLTPLPAGNSGEMGSHRAAAAMEPLPAPPPGVVGEPITTNLSSGERNIRSMRQTADLWHLSNTGVVNRPMDQIQRGVGGPVLRLRPPGNTALGRVMNARDRLRRRDEANDNVQDAQDGRRWGACDWCSIS